jgi:hypothetical protein
MATKLIVLPAGPERGTITVFDGALIRGRLVNHGKPVAGAEVGLIAQNRGGFADKLKVLEFLLSHCLRCEGIDGLRIGNRRDYVDCREGTDPGDRHPPRARCHSERHLLSGVRRIRRARGRWQPPWRCRLMASFSLHQ